MRIAILIVLITLGASCQTTQIPEQQTETMETKTPMNHLIRGSGKIVWNDFEGGFYGIEAQGGIRYYPLGSLDEEFRVDGLQVRFELQMKPGVMTTVMWGTPVSVVSMEKISP